MLSEVVYLDLNPPALIAQYSLDAVPQLPASARPVPAKALGFRPPGWISESTRAAVMRSDSLVYQLFSNSLGVRTLRINGPLAPPRTVKRSFIDPQAVRSELRGVDSFNTSVGSESIFPLHLDGYALGRDSDQVPPSLHDLCSRTNPFPDCTLDG
ncbi:hypothetical protein C8R46DRAFT_1035780 [Mycena filopes]|nr:hypothetical protein C8R46DRAFT_1035780 [Mycena filopes]